ncbi:MAG: hypothetical protein IJT98_01045 [Prevotella sp.]|nr:hypothetical protein [Prevotella sp.]
MATANGNNPWKGLNFYVEGEVLYGRNAEIESLSHYILNNTQTVLYGKSGIGKSSILNAGIFPIARRNGLVPIPIRLDHGKDSPSYFIQVRDAIERSGVRMRVLLPPIDPQKETLWEYLHRMEFTNAERQPVQLLLVFDQFEEIFTLQQDEKRKTEFFDELASLINGVTPLYIVNHFHQDTAAPSGSAAEVTAELDDLDLDLDLGEDSDDGRPTYIENVDYHIVFTLREDFLSYLERYTAFIPAMKQNRFALSPLNEEQAADIIMLPQKGLVSQDVAKLIIEKVTGRTDFQLDGVPELEVDAAVLSLYLSRLYIKKGDGEQQITAELVNQQSNDIIKDFYTECVSGLPAAAVEKIEDELITYDGRRNNVSRYDLEREGVPRDVINNLVYDKKLLRQFNYQGDIRVEFMHDILCPVVDERIDQRELQRQQEQERQRQEEEKRAYMEAELRKREQIEAEAAQEKALMEARAARAKRKNRRRFAWSIGLLAILVFDILFWYFGYQKDYSNYYAGFTYQYGWPVGIGEVGSQGGDSMVVYYRLTRHGFMKYKIFGLGNSREYYKVEVLAKGEKPSTNKLVEEQLVALDETESGDQKAKTFARMQLNTARWEFTPSSNGEVACRTAYDPEGQVLYSLQFYHSAESNDSIDTQQVNELWANYTDGEGKALHVRNNGADRMRITVNSNGHFAKFQFCNEQGVPQKNGRNEYGIAYKLSDDGIILERTPLDELDIPQSLSSLRFTSFDKYNRWIQAKDSLGRPAYATYTNNCIAYSMADRKDTLLYNDNADLVYRSYQFYGNHTWRMVYIYNDNGNLTEKSTYSNDTLRSKISFSYLANSDTISEICEYNTAWSNYKYRLETHSKRGNVETELHFHGNNRQLMVPYNKQDNPPYYRLTVSEDNTDPQYTVKTLRYYAIDTLGIEEKLIRTEELTLTPEQQTKRHIIYNEQGERTMSMEYDIENGRTVGQHVIGICGDTIRCPKWDEQEMSYYTMRFVKDFYDNIVAVRAINEYGSDNTVIIQRSGKQWHREIMAGQQIAMLTDIDNFGHESALGGTSIFSESTALAPQNWLYYIHITDTAGTAYKSNLRDGDMILRQQGREILLARRVKGTRRYTSITVNANINELTGMEPPYKVFLTDEEYSTIISQE